MEIYGIKEGQIDKNTPYSTHKGKKKKPFDLK
jgi:hypothetical protein